MHVIDRPSTIKEDRRDFFRVYDDLGDYATEIAATPPKGSMVGNRRGTKARRWYGNLDWQEAVEHCRNGAPEMVAASDALMEKMEGITAPRPMWEYQDSPVGTTINWGAYHAGTPNIARRRVKTTGDFAPLTIVADLTISANIDADSLIKRGTAVLALARLLCGIRPVTLYVMVSTAAGHGNENGCYSLIPLPSSPLDLARAAFALAHPAFVRGLGYQTAIYFHDFAGHWPYSDHERSYVRNIRALLEGVIPNADSCLYIPSLHSSYDPEVRDPVQWVKDMIAKHGTPQE